MATTTKNVVHESSNQYPDPWEIGPWHVFGFIGTDGLFAAIANTRDELRDLWLSHSQECREMFWRHL